MRRKTDHVKQMFSTRSPPMCFVRPVDVFS